MKDAELSPWELTWTEPQGSVLSPSDLIPMQVSLMRLFGVLEEVVIKTLITNNMALQGQ